MDTVDADDRPDITLGELLSRRARRTPPSRLVIDVAGGLSIAAVAVWARPGGWGVPLSAGLCLLSYGVWATAERRLLASPWQLTQLVERAWRAGHAAAAVLGVASFLLLLLSLLSVGLGRWKS